MDLLNMDDYLVVNQRRFERMMIIFILIASCMLIRDCTSQPPRKKDFNISHQAAKNDWSDFDSSSEESFESKESDEEVLYTDFGPLYIFDNGTGPLPYPFNETKSVIPQSAKRTVGTMALIILGGVFILPVLLGCYKFFKRLNTASSSCFKGRDDMQTWVVDQDVERLPRRDVVSRPPASLALPPNEQLMCTTRDISTSNRTPFQVQFRGRHLSGPEYEMVTILIRTQQDENSSSPIDPSPVAPNVAEVPQPPSYEQATCPDTSTSQDDTVAQNPPPYTKDNTISSDETTYPPPELTSINREDPPPYTESETLLPHSQLIRS